MNLLINLLLSFFISVHAAEVKPLEDNILFAFDKCKTVTVDLNKTALVEFPEAPFDIHCVNDSQDKMLFKCDFFDAGSEKKKALEALNGGKTDKVGQLSNKGGTTITFSIAKGSAAFDSPMPTKSQEHPVRKICAGIFLFEKDALKRKSKP